MKEKIIKALKNKYKDLGFTDKAFDGVAAYLEPSIKEDADIETAIAGVEPLLKAFQGEKDSIRTAKSAAEKKLAELEEQIKNLTGGKPEEEKDDKGALPDDTPAWAKALVESNKALTDRLSVMEGEKRTATRRQQLDETIKTLPESIRKAYAHTNLNVMSDDEFTAFIGDTTKEVETIVKENTIKGAVFGRPATNSRRNDDKNELTREQTDAINKRVGVSGSDKQPF